MRKVILVCLALWSVTGISGRAFGQSAGPNRILNPGFEEAGANWPFANTGAVATGEATTETAHSGKYSHKFTNKTAQKPHIYARIFQTIAPLDPYTTYSMSCYVKGTSVGICWIGGGPGWALRAPFPTGTYDDWKKVSTEFFTDAMSDFDLMICTESETQAVYVDDVAFQAVAADTAKRDKFLLHFNETVADQVVHLRKVQELINARQDARDDAIVRLGVAVARRFLDRILSPDTRQSHSWSAMQLEQVDQVLKETEAQLALVEKRRSRPQPYPTSGAVRMRDGLLFTDTNLGKDQPFYFYGMGHFGQIYKDLPFWRDLGVTMLQDGTCGPSSMNEDGSFREGAALNLIANLRRASMYNMKIDYLLSPHYFPEWAWTKPGHEELGMGGLGFIGFNIDHPIAKDAVGRFAERISAAIKGQPALMSICLSNEPVYDDSGRNPQTLPLYQQYLEQLHTDIGSLNSLYGTSYKSFGETRPPDFGLTADTKKNRAFYDWCQFNKKHFAGWHAWMRDILKKNLPDIPIHAKIMVFFAMDRDKLGWGVDPEMFCDVTDLAGCDAYAFPDGDYKSFAWHGHAFWYDLLHSFRGQPVFDSENHLIADGTGPVNIPMTLTRAQYWQDALHHQPLTTTWVWEEAFDASLAGSIYFRPASIYGACRAFLDMNRFAAEVSAINRAKPRVALLYSPASIFWSDKYQGTIYSQYTQLNFLGEAITFASERQLAENRAPDVKVIIVPQATHVTSQTIAALETFVANGGKIILIGENNLQRDQYDRPLKVPARIRQAATQLDPQKDERDSAKALHQALSKLGLELADVSDFRGDHAWGIEYRVVDHAGGRIMPVTNLGKESQKVLLPKAFARAVDLLSGQEISGGLVLEPMVPHLLRAK
jgi:hypothetical protein